MSFLASLRRYGLVAIPLVFGLTAFGLTRASKISGPVADAPEAFDLGTFDNHEFIDRDVPIRNLCQKDLILTNFHGGCVTCIQFGKKTPNGMETIDTLTVPPGESVVIAARLSVFGAPNKPFNTFIACDTNDPHRPQLGVEFNATIRGQIVSLPPTLDFGNLEPGQPASLRLELRDTGRGEPFRFGRVECPPNVTAKFVDGNPRTSVGGLEVSVSPPGLSWKLDGSISIYEPDCAQPTVTLPVRAVVPPVAEVSPATVLLPRAVGTGSDYTADCRFRSPKGLSLSVRPDVVPSELVLTPLASSHDAGPGFRIEWRPAAIPARGKSHAVVVRFHVEAGGRKETVEMPVRCRSVE